LELTILNPIGIRNISGGINTLLLIETQIMISRNTIGVGTSLKNLLIKNSDSPLKAILLTNVHHDRISQKAKEIFNVPVYIHENDVSELDFEADHTFVNGDKLFCGLKVIHLKNQKSPGESAFYLEDQKKMFVGDALIGKVSGKLNMLPPEKFVDIDEARKSLQVLRSFDFDDLLLGDGECILDKGKETLEEFLN